MGTAERRMDIVKVLCTRRYETMGNLAFEFGVSIRTIQRDINEITSILPIYIKTGRHGGGIYLVDSFKPSNINMSSSEIDLLLRIRDLLHKGNTDLLNEDEIKIFDNIIKKLAVIKS